MKVYEIDPVRDSRWATFVEHHPRATVFHTPEWIKAIGLTYGFQTFALTTAPAGRALDHGVVGCRVKSWLTGHRTVALPFSDHCEPADGANLDSLLSALETDVDASKRKYLEIRPVHSQDRGSGRWAESDSFCFHQLDLRPSNEQLFRGFHRNCVQRKILRAEREGLDYEEGRSNRCWRGSIAWWSSPDSGSNSLPSLELVSQSDRRHD